MSTVICLAAALVVVAVTFVAMLWLGRQEEPVDRVLALQLGGSMGIAAVLLAGYGLGASGVIDLALTAALLAAVTTITFVRSARIEAPDPETEPPMTMLTNILATAAIVLGVCFLIAGVVAVIRLQDPISRIHALTKVDTLGLGLVMLGLALWSPSLLAAVKLLFCWLLVLISGSTACYLVVQKQSAKTTEPPQ